LIVLKCLKQKIKEVINLDDPSVVLQ